MTKYKISIIPIFLLLLSTLLFGCTTKMYSKEVYDKFISYALQEDNIFEATKIDDDSSEDSYEVKIKIGYTNEIEAKLNEEKAYYDASGTPRSDFYLLKVVYEPTLNFALNFFLENYYELKTSNAEISQEDGGQLYDCIDSLKDAIKSFQISLNDINYKSPVFVDTQQGENRYMEDSGLYKRYDSFKIRYANLINKCFELNNKFIKIYSKIHKKTDYRVDSTDALDGVYLQALCIQVVSKLAQAGFMVDGLQCNFLDTNKSSFDIRDDGTDHTYIKHLEMIIDSAKKLLTLSTDDFKSYTGNAELKEYSKNILTQYESFEAQYPMFVHALNKINYRNYIDANTTLEKYLKDKSDKEVSYFTIVENFLNNNYAILCDLVNSTLKKVNKSVA